jgi:DNA processing protein
MEIDKENVKEKIIAFLSRSNNGSVALRKSLEKNFRRVEFTDSELQTTQQKLKRTNLLLSTSNKYPKQLTNLSDYPPALFYKGNTSILSNRIITVVGTRKSSNYSSRVINKLFPSGLWSQNITLLSGLAYGVDALVHKTALRNNISTAAVVAGGIDMGYPRGNQRLYEEIENNGCIIAEFPPGKPIVKGMFPMRNRIMAALADIVIVIEGGEKSGSLITANLALEQGKDVYAVPSDIDREVGKGSNVLIQNGAGVLTSHQDLLNVLDIDIADIVNNNTNLNLSKSELKVFAIVKEMGEISIEMISQKMKLAIHIITPILTKMEIEGILSRTGTGKYEIC